MPDDETLTGPHGGQPADPMDPTLAVPERLGAYRILQRIGEGGMSTVFLAVRDDDTFRKRVAVKVIRPALRSSQMIHRFRQERQILASLEHENIARLLDGGSADGVPYFVMEYVEGQPIDQYCDAGRLSIEERLRLFRTVCLAVQFAHQNLVVHRDIKPSNVLVTAAGVPKLVDFGIAKLLNPELTADELAPTRFDVRIMTPEYASPEQVRGEPITTASDVYSLGVLLFELLTGERPYPVAGRSLEEVSRVITGTDPARPSSLARTKGDHESDGDPARLRRQLRGDLDNITLMALRKEPQRRYASAQQLADDVANHLAGLPVIARRDTLAYRSGKFVGRHPWGVAAAGLFLILLIGFASTMAVQSVRLAAERDRSETARLDAEKEAAKAQAINQFLRELLGSAGPFDGMRRDVTVVEALDRAEQQAKEGFAGQEEVKAGVLNTIGTTYFQLGRYEEAERLMRAALEMRRRSPSPPSEDLAESLNDLGVLLAHNGRYAEAEASLREALSMRRQVHGEEHLKVAETAANLGGTLEDLGRLDEAEALYRESLSIRQKLAADSPAVGRALSNLGNLFAEKRDYAAAEEMLQQAVALDRKAFGPEHPVLATALNNLAIAQQKKGNLEAAEASFRESLGIRRKVLGGSHVAVAESLNNMGMLLARKGEFSSAEPMLREACDILVKNFGTDHPRVAVTLVNLGGVHKNQGDLASAERDLREGVGILRKVGANRTQLANALYSLGLVLLKEEKLVEAASVLSESIDFRMGAPNPDATGTAVVRSYYGNCLTRLKRFPEAERALLTAREVFVGTPDSKRTSSIRGNLEHLVELYDAWGRKDEAARYRGELAALGAGSSSR